MSLFSSAQVEQINKIAAKSMEALAPAKAAPAKSINSELQEMESAVLEYFKDSPAILIQSKDELHDYVSACIDYGYAGIDTETTGLDRINDHLVGASLYVPGRPECYIPFKHLIPIFEQPYKNQLTYQDFAEELERLVQAKTRLILANADFDIAMIYHDTSVAIEHIVYYDVILAWRCLKEDEQDNTLKGLYAKYVMKGKVDPKKFSDFFSPKLFPYCKPEIAKLYAANDAKITFDLAMWQWPYVTKSNAKCQKAHLEKIADLVWNVEMPMVKVCANLHRVGVYLDDTVSRPLHERYSAYQSSDEAELTKMVQQLIDDNDSPVNRARPFRTGADFNPNSQPHVLYLVQKLLNKPDVKSTGKDELKELNLPVTSQILKVRGDVKLLTTYVDKLPGITGPDDRIHCSFKSIGAACVTGDTILPTSSGYRRIQDICESYGCVEGSHVDAPNLVIANKDQVAESASSVIRYSDVETIKLTTECGFVLEGTFNHPIMVSKYKAADEVCANSKELISFWQGRQFKRLDEISVGDWIEIPCNYDIGPSEEVATDFKLYPAYQTSRTLATVPDRYTDDLAEFLGMYHADGSAYLREGTYTITISNDNPDIISRFEYLGKQLFNVTASHYTAQADKHEVETYLNCMQIRDIDRILSHGKRNKRIPAAIWMSPKHVINSYIRGMTLDSSVYLNENGRAAFELSIVDETDARLVQCHLASQGILCYMSHNENKDGWLTPRLAFNADNYLRFRDCIGFIESSKYKDIEPCKKNKYSSRRIENSFRLKVKSIEHSFNTVYDLHVPGSHSFISNGMISHNTGRMSSEAPNMQNIPSHATDIRHMFRATPGYVMLGSDYSQQEPRVTAFAANDKTLIKTFQDKRDIYATLASVAFKVPYEECLEFHPETHEYQPEGKARRGMGKVLVLGINYGMTVEAIAEDLYGTRTDMSDEEKVKEAQKVYDSLMAGLPDLRNAILNAQRMASELGYTETILGRRRHHPNMQLPEFEFKPMKGYMNPDIDPLDPSTLNNREEIPQRIINQLTKEFKNYKYYGQIVKRTKALAEEKIKVINNRQKIAEASRQVWNAVIQGSAADMTKLAMIKLTTDPDWNAIGGKFLIPVHDELLTEVPYEFRKEGAEILSRCMCDAGSFLPFDLTCDVETTFRWYGLSVDTIESFDKPASLIKEDLTESNIKWLQCMIFENEYLLPIYKNEDGSKPIGDAAHGINGKWSDELDAAISDYRKKYRLHDDLSFIEHIDQKVRFGVIG